MRVRRCARERAAVQREDLPAELMPGGRAARSVRVGNDGRIARDREGRGRSADAVSSVQVRAAISGGLRVVPRCERVVRVHPTLAGEEGDLDRTARHRAVLRELQDHALRRDLVLRVVRVVRVEDPVDPVLGTAGRRARRSAVRALVECRYRCVCSRRGTGYRRNRQERCRRDERDRQQLEGAHLPHLRFLPSLPETRYEPGVLPLELQAQWALAVSASQGIPRFREQQSLGRGSVPMARANWLPR